MKSSPKFARFFLVPARKPSPSPTRSNSEPTPQAMPNMVRKERSLCAHIASRTWPKLSTTPRYRILPLLYYIGTVMSMRKFPALKLFHRALSHCDGNHAGLALRADCRCSQIVIERCRVYHQRRLLSSADHGFSTSSEPSLSNML